MLKDHFLPDKRRVAQRYGEDRTRRVREYQYQVVVLLEACWVSTEYRVPSTECTEHVGRARGRFQELEWHGGALAQSVPITLAQGAMRTLAQGDTMRTPAQGDTMRTPAQGDTMRIPAQGDTMRIENPGLG